MYAYAFSSSFLPSFSTVCSLCVDDSISIKHPVRRRASCQLGHPKNSRSNRDLRFIALGVTALSFVFGKPPAQAQVFISTCQDVSASQVWKHLQPSATYDVLKVKPRHTVASVDHGTLSARPAQESPEYRTEGTLLQIEPANLDDSARLDKRAGPVEGPLPQSTLPSRTGPARYRQHRGSTSSLPKGGSSRLRRAILASDRFLRLRTRVSPSTLGIVGFGAFTSGSVFLRSVTRKVSALASDSATGADLGEGKSVGYCSVVCMHIPFCVPERKALLDGLTRIANTASLVTAEGMCAAARDTASLLLQENGLLEDSRKFAPDVDVFLADSIVSAERRFSGHVATEDSRIERISTKTARNDANAGAKMGQYGAITLVIATTDGVDLECYDEKTTKVKRLRAALASVERLHSGDIAGLELRWVPEAADSRFLTGAQLSDAFPSLHVV